MQNLAVLLLFGMVASMVFVFTPVLAQTPEQTPESEQTDEQLAAEVDEGQAEEQTTEEDLADEETIQDEQTQEDTEETATGYVESPLEQLKSGVDPHEIQCGDGLKLVFKASNFRPACLKESSYTVLLQRGWVSEHDPSHEELMGMMETIPKDEVMEENGVELDEDVQVQEDATSGNGTEPTPQSHTIELSESMEMGAN